MGLKTLIEILQCYIVTAEQLTNALAEACAEEKWDEAARLAQDIVGAAGGIGLSAMTQAARHFAQASRDGESVSALRNAAQTSAGRACARPQGADQSLSRIGGLIFSPSHAAARYKSLDASHRSFACRFDRAGARAARRGGLRRRGPLPPPRAERGARDFPVGTCPGGARRFCGGTAESTRGQTAVRCAGTVRLRAPGQPAVPSALGLARALGLELPLHARSFVSRAVRCDAASAG